MRESTAPRPSVTVICVISAVFLVYVWDRVIVPIQAVEIRSALGLSLPQIGLLGSVFTFGLMLAAIPSGLLAARYGTRASLVLGAAVFSAATLWFGLANSVVVLILLRVVSGIGEAFYNVSLLTFLGQMTRRHRSFAAGFPATLFGLGVFSGPPVIAGLRALSPSWREPFIILGCVGLAGTAVIWALLRKGAADVDAQRTPITLARVAAVLTPGTIAVYVTIAATGTIVYSYLSLLQGYLRSENGLGATEAGAIFSLFGIGSAIGGIGMGALGDLIGRGRFVTIATVIVAAVGASVFWVSPSLLVSGALSLAIGVGTNGIYCNSIALVQDRSGYDSIPIATGLLAIIYYLMSAFSGYLVAQLAGTFGWATTGLIAYAAPYLLIAPFLYALVWQNPDAAPRTAADPMLTNARH